eukprot:6487133-Amphidinium_carterae.1
MHSITGSNALKPTMCGCAHRMCSVSGLRLLFAQAEGLHAVPCLSVLLVSHMVFTTDCREMRYSRIGMLQSRSAAEACHWTCLLNTLLVVAEAHHLSTINALGSMGQSVTRWPSNGP